jgi:RHS repeat-associated protein
MKRLLLSIAFLIAVNISSGQETSESFVLDEPIQQNITRNLIASDFISLTNKYPDVGGFHVKPDENNQFNAKIDPYLMIPPIDNEWGGVPENNNGGGVGLLMGELNINPNGAMEYNVPLELPDGLAGLKPKLSFIYNSMAGDGIMGDGWSIGGLSKITRVPNTYYYNNFTSSVVLNNDDQLALDGNYLIKKPNVNEYKPEVETFDKIVVKDNNINNGFFVYKKNGFIYEYGTIENSRIYLQDDLKPISWYLCKITDLNNNYIEFNYINDRANGDLYPDYILYTGNSHELTNPFYKINFNYRTVERTNNPKKYFANEGQTTPLFTKQTQLLKEVELVYLEDNIIVKTYYLYYEKIGELEKDYLTSIYANFNMAERTTRWLNPLKFEWDISNYGLDKEEEDLYIMNRDGAFSNIIQEGVFEAQFDDNPKSDLLFVVKNTSNKIRTIKAYINWSDYYGDNTNFNFQFNTNSGSGIFNKTFDEQVNNVLISPGDFNGDGKEEILRVAIENQKMYLYLGNFIFSGAGSYEEELLAGPIAINYDETSPPVFLVSDFSGNGMDDLCIVSESSSNKQITDPISGCLFFLSFQDAPLSVDITSSQSVIEKPNKVLTGDFNGNGKTEILTIGNSSAKVISLSEDNSTFYSFNTTNDFTNINYLNDIVAGDFNGDAKTDVLMLKQGNVDNWKYYFSYGKGLFINNITKSGDDIGAKQMRKFIVDVNGDGYSDVCKIENHHENVGDIDYIMYYRTDYLTTHSNNDITTIQKIYDDPITSVKYPGERQEVDFCLGNFSGNSSNQLICSRIWSNTNNIYAKISLTAPIYNTFHNEISNIKDSFGNDVSFVYTPFTAIPIPILESPITKSDSRTEYEFPIIHHPGILQVVTETKTEVVKDNFLSTKYYYTNPRYHKIGKGFLGFELVKKFDDINGTWTTKHYSIDNSYYHVVNDLTEIKIKIAETVYKDFESKSMSFSFRLLDPLFNIRYYPMLEEKIIKTYELDGGVKQIHKQLYSEFDEYGSPKKITESFSTNNTTWPISQTTNYLYLNLNNSDKYVIGLPSSKIITFKKQGKPNVVKSFEYEYFESTNCKLKIEKIEPLDPNTYSNNYKYDNFGNISEHLLKGTGMEDRTNSIFYTTNGRFIDYKINPLGHTESFTFYEKSGLPKTITDANGLTTTFSKYDIFGRLKEIISPIGNKTGIVYRWAVTGSSSEHELGPETTIMYKWEKSSGNVEKLTFYDSFNRIVREATKSFDGSWRMLDYNYYGNISVLTGLLKESSMPYFAGDQALFTEYIYDKLRRVEKTTHPDGSYAENTFNASNTVIRDFDGQVRKNEFNEAGWTYKTTNNQTGTVNYSFTSDGLVVDAIINAKPETKVSKTYDAFRKVKTINDPDNGETTYTYNSFGELVLETDNISTSKFSYDKLGRMINKKSPNEFTLWQYDTHENGIGALNAVAHSPSYGEINQVVYEYDYDEFVQITGIKQTLNGDQIEANYTYDVYGRPKSTIWPSGLITTNYYKPGGFLNYIGDSDQNILWKLLEEDKFGNPSKYELGNSIITQSTYKPENGMLTDIVSKNGTVNIQNIHYEWETIGNLRSRQDMITSNTESFLYDEFNRLTECMLNNNLQLSSNFNGIGNITYKSDVGTYKYDEPNMHPHAVTGVEGVPETISRLIQTIDYTSFDKVFHISEKEEINSTEDVFTLDISYGPNNERVWQRFINNQTHQSSIKKYFNSVFETVDDGRGNIKQQHYLSSPSGIFAIFTIDNNDNKSVNYLLKDHIGSITQIVDENANIIQKMNFDAWGRRRNPTTWTYDGIENESFVIDRGFTMHEHLTELKLINMNGRMYDPVMGRFLSTDPIIQLPDYNQSYNRYTYALNNPLRFIDPSGFSSVENMDWFFNEVTGKVHYNSDLRKGDEDKLDGEGWVHLAENNKLSESGESDYDILWKNRRLGNIKENIEYDSHVAKDAKVTSFTQEATFKGKNAEVFMNGQGYDKVPTQQIIYEQKYTIKTQKAPRQPSLEIRITEKSQYLKKGYYNAGWKYKGDPTIRVNAHDTEYIGKAHIHYTSNSLITTFLKILDFMYPSSPVIFNSKSEYPNNVKLINEFLEN